MTFDAAKFGRAVARTIKEQIAPLRESNAALVAANKSLLQRIDGLERQVAAATVKGASIDRAGVLFITLGNGEATEVGPVVGRDADPVEVARLVTVEVARQVAEIEIPTPAPLTPADLRPLVGEVVTAEVERQVAELPPATPGRDADPAEVARLVTVEVARQVAEIEIPTPAPLTPADLRPLVGEVVNAEVARQVEAIEPARDGRGIAGALVDGDGALVLTLTDGSTLKAGRVTGRDGADLEDLQLTTDDGRTFRLEAKAGGRRVSCTFKWPGVVDRGIWRERAYDAGDGVTYKGSYWLAERETDRRPGDDDSGWRLAVKRGRDGRPDRRTPALQHGAI